MTQAEKKVPLCEITSDDTTGTISFNYSNGTVLSIKTDDMPTEQIFNLIVHGLTQKVRDSFSSAKGDVEYAIGCSNKVLDNLMANRWTASRATGEGKPKSTELVEAIARLKGLPIETVAEIVEQADDAKRKIWRSNARIKAEIANIRAERAAAAAAKSSASDDFDIE